MSRNTVSVLINECERSGLIKAIPNGYEITEKSLSHTAVGNKVDSPIYKAICGFCGMKGANPPVWDKDAMSVILTRYNSVDLPPDHEMNIGFQLNRRCGRLPQKVTLAYFIKVLGMETQYRAVILAKSAKSRLEYAF